MKKLCFMTILASAMIGTTGCVSYSNRMPQGGVALEPLKTTATYDIVGDATGTAKGEWLFGFMRVGGEDKSGQMGNGLVTSSVEGAAMYNAIESVPTADALLAPRFSSTHSNYFFYRSKTVTVKGKAIRYNASAK
jgi:hypothetical protein